MQISVSTWKRIIDLQICLPSQDMLEILQWAEVSQSANCIHGVLLYTDEVFLKNRHRTRRGQVKVSQDREIGALVERVGTKHGDNE